MRVILFKVNHLGDNLVFLPVAQALRRRFPAWQLTVITVESERSLYAADLPRERIWTAPGRIAFNHNWRRPWQLLHWWWRVRRVKPDACLLSYDQGNSAHLLAWFSGARIRIGAHMPFVHFRRALTHAVGRTASRKIADWNWAMGRELALAAGATDWPESPPPPDLRHLTGTVAREPGLVVIHAGARATIRRWGAERMAEVGRRLAADGHRVVWIDRPDTHVATLPPGVQRVACDALPELARLLARAALFLCNNSGPMHLANALGTPLVVVSGPTSYDWDPYWHQERCSILRWTELPCIACEDSGVGTEHCVNRATPLACLHHWTVEAVAAACRTQLARRDGFGDCAH